MNKAISAFDSKEFMNGTILDIATSFSHLPASFMKVSTAMVSDAPEEIGTNEFACIVYGNSKRRIVLLSDYSSTVSYTRAIFEKDWRASWKKYQ